MTFDEFKISTRNNVFRIAKLSPVDLLAISTQIDFSNLKMTKTLITFCLENIEVKIGEAWLPVKVKDKEIYQPKDIVNDLSSLSNLYTYFIENVIVKTFMKSDESTNNVQQEE